jgi:uncharacterized protein YdeI (YjbR/CyaY-like superfamily)
MAQTLLDQFQRVEIDSLAVWHRWLLANHQRSNSIWLVSYKKSAPDRYVAYGDIVDEALCFGWIDSLPRKLDAERTMLLLSPRRSGSAWSAVNKAKIARLEREGRMHESGRAAVQRAKEDDSWNKLDDVEQLVEPHDLADALDAQPAARRNFEAFNRSSRRGILEWIMQAKRPETRARRIEETVRLAERNIKANHPAANKGG